MLYRCGSICSLLLLTCCYCLVLAEMKEAKQRKKQLAAQLKQEEILTSALKVWMEDILPTWETM